MWTTLSQLPNGQWHREMFESIQKLYFFPKKKKKKKVKNRKNDTFVKLQQEKLFLLEFQITYVFGKVHAR